MVIGDNVTIGHGVVVHAARIGNSVLLSNNCVVLNYAEIDDFCVVASGSVVLARMKVPQLSFVDGVPGELRGELRPNQVERVRNGGPHHARMAAEYRATRLVTVHSGQRRRFGPAADDHRYAETPPGPGSTGSWRRF